jgi:hypothetical protein
MREGRAVHFHSARAVLLMIPCSLLLLAPATRAVAGSPINPCTLVTKAEAAAVLGGAVKDVKSESRGEEELKRLWDSLDEEQKKAGMSLFIIEDARCEYSNVPNAPPADPDSYVGGSLSILVGRARNKEEAAKAFRRACSGEGHSTLTYKQLSGIGDSACSIEDSGIMVLKNDIILSLIHVFLSSGDVVAADIKPLAVKAVSRLP